MLACACARSFVRARVRVTECWDNDDDSSIYKLPDVGHKFT